MYKLCKSEQSALRQRGLEQQLLKMMETVRFEEITVSDLCSQAGVSRKAFYRYFSGKEGALYALIDHTLWELESFPFDGMHSDRDTCREKMTWFFRFWQRQNLLLDVLDNSGLSEILTKRVVVYALSNPSAMQSFLPYEDGNLQEYATNFGVFGIMSMVYIWHRSGYRQSPEQMADITVNLLTKPLIPTKKTG